jgi:vacuolar-type H+-ATPase subunit H
LKKEKEKPYRMSEEERKSEARIALQKIKEAEEKGKNIIETAREKEALRIIQDAYDEAKTIKESVLTKARAEAEKKKKAIIQKATKEAEKIKRETEKEAALLSKDAEKTVSKAVEKIARSIGKLIEGELYRSWP